MNNLHIHLNEFIYESRGLKEAQSLVKHSIVNNLYIAALHKEGLKEEEFLDKNINIKRFSLSSRKWNKSLVLQGFKYIEFSYKILKYYKRKDIKIVNIHSLDLLLLGVLLKYFYKAKLIYDTHELETEKNGLKGIRKKISKLVEKVLIKQSDLIFVVSENIADWYKETYNINRPTVVFNAPKEKYLKNNNLFQEKLNIKDEQLIFLYQGGLTKGRGVHIILDAFKQRNDNKAVVIFMGYGEMEEEISLTSMEHNNIFFYPAVPPNYVLEYTSSADIGLHLIENTCLNHFYCMPNKIFEYSMGGLALIVSNMKEMAEYVRNNNIGFVLEENSPEALNGLVDYILMQKDIEKFKKNSYETAKLFSWENQEKKLVIAYKKLLENKGRKNELK